MRYAASAYSRTEFVRLVDTLETDFKQDAIDFVSKHCENGCNCSIIDREASKDEWFYAEEPSDPMFYDDLHMEQCEQM